MRIRRTDHTGFTVSNIERSVAFYRDVLGLEVVSEQLGTADYLASVTGFPGVRLKMAFIKASAEDNHILELLEYESHPGEPTPRETNRPGNGHLCLVVDDIQAWYHELTARGVTFIGEPTTITAGVHRGDRAVYLRDPDGFTLELCQPAS